MIKTKHWIYAALFLICVGFLSHKCSRYEEEILNLETELLISKQNYLAETDSLRSDIRTKEGDIVYMKNMYLTREDELNEKLSNLEKNNDDLKLKLNHYMNINAQVKHDTIIMKPDTIVKGDSVDMIHFNYKDEWTAFKGTTNYHKYNNDETFTRISDLTISAPLDVGLTDDHQIVITSKNPNLSITDVTGISALRPQKKPKFKFSHGIQFGVGAQYGLVNGKVDIGPTIGYGFELKF